MSDCHKKKCHEKRSCWCGIVIFLLGGLILLGLVALIFGFKGKEPIDNFFMDISLTSTDSSNVVYKDVEPQPVSITANFDPNSDACEARITLESKNGDIFEDIKFAPSDVNQAVTLVGEKVTKITVDATNGDDQCMMNFKGSTGGGAD